MKVNNIRMTVLQRSVHVRAYADVAQILPGPRAHADDARRERADDHAQSVFVIDGFSKRGIGKPHANSDLVRQDHVSASWDLPLSL
jgi:hypothetical protein